MSMACLACLTLPACGKSGPTYSGPPVASLSLSAPSTNVIIGKTLQLSVTMLDIYGASVTGAPVQWQSSATSIATVTQGGLVTGRAVGTARIRGSSGNGRDSVNITVGTNTFDVYTPGDVFSPTVLEVPVGATVRFHMFGEEGHDATFANVPGRPAHIPVVNNQIVPRQFNTSGTFPYDCNVHPGMSGAIIVE